VEGLVQLGLVGASLREPRHRREVCLDAIYIKSIVCLTILHSSANDGNFVPSLGKMPRVYFKVRNINIHLVVLEELHNQRRID